MAGAAAGAVHATATLTIKGTSHNDVLRGTAKADRIYGRAGNDKLYGRGGNDLLVGGAGADRISCGPGRDRVIADDRDTVASDCESVTYVDSTPQPAPAPAPPPAPQPPPPALPQDGQYSGKTAQGEVLSFQISGGGRSVSNLSFSLDFSCSPGGSLNIRFGPAGPEALAAGGSFGFDWNGPLVNLDGTPSNSTTTTSVRGSIAADGTASGSMHGTATIVYGGGFQCSTDTVSWTATKQ